MCSKSFISALILYLCFDYTHQHRNHQRKLYGVVDGIRPTEKEWDFVIFTQQWPSSWCKVWTHRNPNHHCVFPKQSDSWTVHGIWPTKTGTKGPFNCNTTWLFDPEQVRPIEAELEQAWTNIEKGNFLLFLSHSIVQSIKEHTGDPETQIYNLWAHEWNKHGTCAAMIEPFNSEFKYFSKGIDFLNEYHMTDMLNAAKIIPSDTYQLKAEDINSAVVSKIKIRPFIACEFEDGIQYLVELRICFDKQLNLIECRGEEEVNGLLTNCNLSKGIVYPTEMPAPNHYLVQLYKFINWVQWFTL